MWSRETHRDGWGMLKCVMVFQYQVNVGTNYSVSVGWFHICGFNQLRTKNIWKKKFHKVPQSKSICHAATVYIALTLQRYYKKFPGGGSDRKESAYSTGDSSLIPGSGRSPGEGKGYPLQRSCLENSMDRGAWQAIQPMGLQRVRHDLTT